MKILNSEGRHELPGIFKDDTVLPEIIIAYTFKEQIGHFSPQNRSVQFVMSDCGP